MNVGKQVIMTMGFALAAAVAQAVDMDKVSQALNQFNASMQQLNQQIQQQNAGAAEVQQPAAAATVQVQTPITVNTTAQQRAALDAKIQFLRTKIDRERQHLADAEGRLNQAASSGGSTIALMQTVRTERTIVQTYENQLAQLEAQRAQL